MQASECELEEWTSFLFTILSFPFSHCWSFTDTSDSINMADGKLAEVKAPDSVAAVEAIEFHKPADNDVEFEENTAEELAASTAISTSQAIDSSNEVSITIAESIQIPLPPPPSSLPLPDAVDPAVKTVAELWKEFHEGIRGRPPLLSVVEDPKHKWSTDTTCRNFGRRRKILDEVERRVEQFNLSPAKVCAQLDRYMVEQPKINSLYRLGEVIKQIPAVLPMADTTPAVKLTPMEDLERTLSASVPTQ